MEKRELIDIAIESADLGRKYWIDLLDKYSVTKKDMIIFLVNDSQEYNYYTLKYLKAFKENNKLNNIFIVSDIEGIETYVKENASTDVTFISCNEEQRIGICRLYRLYKFSRQIIINEFENTSDVSADRLVGVGDITVKDIVAIAILGLPEVPMESE